MGDRRAVGKGLNNLGRHASRRDDHDTACEYYRRALEIFRDVDDRHDVARVLSNLGAAATEQGSYDEARDHLERALEGFRDVVDRHKEARCLVRYGRLAREMEDVATARERGERTLPVLEDIGATKDTFEAYELLVDCARKEGDTEQALSWCRDALAHLAGPDGTGDDAYDEHRRRFESHQDRLEGTVQ